MRAGMVAGWLQDAYLHGMWIGDGDGGERKEGKSGCSFQQQQASSPNGKWLFFALLAWPRLVMEDQISGDHALVVLSRLLLVLASAGGG